MYVKLYWCAIFTLFILNFQNVESKQVDLRFGGQIIKI